MNRAQLKHLKNIGIMDTDAFYRLKVGIPYVNPYGETRYLYPVFAQFICNEIYDYAPVARAFLRRKRITAFDVDNRFNCKNYSHTIVYKIRDLTPEKAQEIINTNIALFTQIAQRIDEQELIDQINNV